MNPIRKLLKTTTLVFASRLHQSSDCTSSVFGVPHSLTHFIDQSMRLRSKWPERLRRNACDNQSCYHFFYPQRGKYPKMAWRMEQFYWPRTIPYITFVTFHSPKLPLMNGTALGQLEVRLTNRTFHRPSLFHRLIERSVGEPILLLYGT